ncbi:MAG: transcription elongation factor GreA [Actinobacteria bacterium]|nr:transcription elongation factor GreA [Actinomycetota bacterium]
MQREIALTREGAEKLEEELRYLEKVRRREVGDRIKEAKEFGDISENSEYDDAKNEQAWVEGRIAEINLILSNAIIIAIPKKCDCVSLGSLVELQDLETEEVHKYRLVGSAEADPDNDRISNESPVGHAIIGSKKGELVKVSTPSGRIIEYRILKISK